MRHDEKWQEKNLPKYIDHNAHMQVAASDFAEAYHEHMNASLLARIAELEAALAESHRKWCEQLSLAKELYIVCTNNDLDVMGDAWKRATEKKITPHSLLAKE